MQLRSTSGITSQSLGMLAAVAATCFATAGTGHAETHAARRFLDPSRSPVDSRTGISCTEWDDGELIYCDLADLDDVDLPPRETSEQEHLIAKLRGWESLKRGWDGEGAKEPNAASVRAASSFLCAMNRHSLMPEPMLHSNGRAGLFWHEDDMYVDLEFLEDASIAYYIERGGDRHKGKVAFDTRSVPAVLVPILPS